MAEAFSPRSSGPAQDAEGKQTRTRSETAFLAGAGVLVLGPVVILLTGMAYSSLTGIPWPVEVRLVALLLFAPVYTGMIRLAVSPLAARRLPRWFTRRWRERTAESLTFALFFGLLVMEPGQSASVDALAYPAWVLIYFAVFMGTQVVFQLTIGRRRQETVAADT